MKRGKLSIALAAMLALVVAMTGCGGSQTTKTVQQKGDLSSKLTEVMQAEQPEKNPDLAKSRKDTLIIGVNTPDGVLNPLYADSDYDNRINTVIFDYLLGKDPQGQPVPGVAEKWEVSADGLEYTFHLRKNAAFHDGSPVTAEDVAFSYYILSDSSYDGPADVFSYFIKGCKAYHDGKATTIEGIQIIDPYTIKFVLEKPNASVIYSFTEYFSPILSKAYYGKDYKQGNTEGIKKLHRAPMGSGPYKFVQYKEGIETILTANESYWRGKPKIKNVIYKATNENTRIQMLSSGEIDLDEVTVNARNVAQLKSAGFLTIQMHPTNGYGYIAMNIANPMFSDRKVRQALAYGLNRKQVVDAVYEGYADVSNEPESKVGWAFNPDVNPYEYNLEKAARMLDEAGWIKGADGIREKDGRKFIIHFTASSPNPVNDALIPVAKQNYEQLGIQFVPEQMEFNGVVRKQKSGEAEMFFMAWGLNTDPDSTTIFKTRGTQNYLHYSNAKVDALLEKGLATTNLAERKQVYQELYKELNEDLPYIFMYQRRDMYPINARVKGISISPYRNFTYDLWQAELL
ncbi:Oligopeptide-binding protein AppA [Sporomusa rhizae]|uniref:ABC transporter substrate-binding protein n=1 Tax=Sporomusa rhizae TaxID=357999 RepID=UPI00352A0385